VCGRDVNRRVGDASGVACESGRAARRPFESGGDFAAGRGRGQRGGMHCGGVGARCGKKPGCGAAWTHRTTKNPGGLRRRGDTLPKNQRARRDGRRNVVRKTVRQSESDKQKENAKTMFDAKRRVLWVAVSLVGFSCSKNHSLTVRVITPPGSEDPFLAANQVRMTLGDKQTTSQVTSGRFTSTIEIESPQDNQTGQLLLEALDAGGQVVGRGRTPTFVLQRSDAEVAVYVGKPGFVTSSELQLPSDDRSKAQGRKALSACALKGRRGSPNEPSLGALIVGGEAEGTLPMAQAWMFKPSSFQLLDGGTISQGRRGAVVVPSADGTIGQQALLVGGAFQGQELATQTEKFDPSVSTLKDVWSKPSAEIGDIGKPGLYAPGSVEIQDSVFLVAGGLLGPTSEQASGQAVLVKRFPAEGSDTVTRLGVAVVQPAGGRSTAMVVPRYQHSMTALATGILVFGGLSFADATALKSVAELYSPEQNQFAALVFAGGAPQTRRGHVAAKLKTGQAWLVGGYTEDAARAKTVLDSALVVDVSARTFAEQPGTLKTARFAASLHESAGEFVVCGGFDKNNKVLADCEAFSTETGRASRPAFAMPKARAEHLAVPLENDLTMFVGGVDADQKPLPAIDFYTSK